MCALTLGRAYIFEHRLSRPAVVRRWDFSKRDPTFLHLHISMSKRM